MRAKRIFNQMIKKYVTTPLSLNRYVYVLNNPLLYIDAWGLSAESNKGTVSADVTPISGELKDPYTINSSGRYGYCDENRNASESEKWERIQDWIREHLFKKFKKLEKANVFC